MMNSTEDILRRALREKATRGIIESRQIPPRVGADLRRTRHTLNRTALLMAAVVLLVVSIIGGVQLVHKNGQTQTATVVTGKPSQAPPSAIVSKSAVPTTPPVVGAPITTAFSALHTSFVDAEHGWALGAYQCGSSTNVQCTELARTTDGGRSWATIKTPESQGCQAASNCLTDLAFGSESVGYAYSTAVGQLFMTKDAGFTWTSLPGLTAALGIVGPDVVRITFTHTGCPGPCGLAAETGKLGEGAWSSFSIAKKAVDANDVLLESAGHYAYLRVNTGTPGGLPFYTFYLSADSGRSWVKGGDPCLPTTLNGRYSGSFALSSDGSISMLCGRTLDFADEATVTSSPATERFGQPESINPKIPAEPGNKLGVFSSSVYVISAPDGLWRSDDGGATWKPVLSVQAGSVDGPSVHAGSMATWVAGGGKVVWVSSDAGKTWSSRTFA
jgi:hypothetical protein